MSVAKRSPPRGEPYVEPPAGAEPAPDAAPQEPSVARSLIRVGDDSQLTLVERVAARLHRLAWRTPMHALRLKGRYPLKLLAVPRDALAHLVVAGCGGSDVGGMAAHAAYQPFRKR